MKLIITNDYASMSQKAARILATFIAEHPNANLCLPTGGSVEGTYLELCELLKNENISMADVTAFNMDEYAPLSRENPNSYYYFMKKHLYSKTDIDLARTYSPNAVSPDLVQACADYTNFVKTSGGFDFTLLGIGSDGHIAFNMPHDQLYLDTHIEHLSEETIIANSRFFDSVDEVPKKAVSIGIRMIMKSRKIVLVASGSAKASILGRMFNERMLDPNVPASMLWLHPDVTFILDEAAAAQIKDTSVL